MSETDHSARAAELIDNVRHATNGHAAEACAVVRRKWAARILAAIAALSYAAILIMAFTVIIARQHTIDTLRNQIDTEAALTECRSWWANYITEVEREAESSERDMVALIARQVASTTPPDFAVFLAAVERVEDTDRAADAAIQARTNWLEDGSPLPCPISP